MKKSLMEVCDQMDAELACQRPNLLFVLLKDMGVKVTLEEFERSLTDHQQDMWLKLRQDLRFIRSSARVGALKLSSEDEIDKVKRELAELIGIAGKTEGYDDAVIEIERNAHLSAGGISEMVKSFFMWKESPDERLDSD